MSYPLLKLIHILSATIMIGTGLGSAFYFFITYKKASFSTVKEILKFVIFADLIFTTPSVIVQLITGLMLSTSINVLYSTWFWLVLSISFVVVILWLVAVFVQLKLYKSIEHENEYPSSFHSRMKVWICLGVPSFLGAISLYYLMVYKPFT